MDNTVSWILRVAVGALASIMIVVVIALLAGIFTPSVNNEDIFAIIGPAFNTVIGAFVGLLGGLSLNNIKEPTESKIKDSAISDSQIEEEK
jgi:hypothetical protein